MIRSANMITDSPSYMLQTQRVKEPMFLTNQDSYTAKVMPRAKIGDIIEIPTVKGLAYAQYTHQHPTHGGLIRVFDRLFESRPTDLKQLVNEPVRFSTFLPVRVTVSRGLLKVVGHQDITPKNQTFPI